MITTKLAGDTVTIHESSDFDAQQFAAFAARNTLFGLDVESHPLDHVDKLNMYATDAADRWLRLVQLGDDYEAWNLNPYDAEQRAALLQVLRDASKQYVSWSAIDPICIETCLGVDITSRYYDGLTLALLLEPGEIESHRLKEWTARYGMPELSNAEDALKQRWAELQVRMPQKPQRPKRRKQDTDESHAARLREYEDEKLPSYEQRLAAYYERFPGGWSGWRDVDLDDHAYQLYAGLDAIGVHRIWPMLVEACKVRGIYRSAIKDELWQQQDVTRMQLRGMLVDLDYARAQLDDIGTQHLQARADFMALASVSPQSPKRAAWLRERGIEFTKFTDNGNPALGKIHVQDLLAKYDRDSTDADAREALRLLIDFAKTKNLTDFVTSLLEFTDASGRVHPNIRALGAETGRWTVNKPAMQTLSSRNPVRGCFVPRPGHVLVSIDQAQIEVRVAAALAGEQSLIDAFNAGVDGYNAVAERLFGAGFTKQQRSIAKRVVLATLYGSGIDTIVRQLHDLDGIVIDPETVAEVRNNFRESYPAIQRMSRALNTGKDVWLPSGRFVPGDTLRTYRGINSACQGTARDLLVQTLKRVGAAGYGACVLMCIHDEILFELPEEGLRDALLKLKACFEQPFRGVNVACDIEIYAERWGRDMLTPRREGLCAKTEDGYEVRRQWLPANDTDTEARAA